MKHGFRVLDSDLHTMEPDGLWEQYLDEPFKKFAPRFTRRAEGAPNQPVISVGNVEIAEMSKRARPQQLDAGFLRDRSRPAQVRRSARLPRHPGRDRRGEAGRA